MENQFSFNKGWGNLKVKDQPEVKKEIMQALNLSTDQAFRQRRRGVVEHKMTEARHIEQIFMLRGVKDVWGNE